MKASTRLQALQFHQHPGHFPFGILQLLSWYLGQTCRRHRCQGLSAIFSTSLPLDPTRSITSSCKPMAVKVSGPAIPSTFRPFFSWNDLIAARVPEPKSPSAAMPNFSCRRLTGAPFIPFFSIDIFHSNSFRFMSWNSIQFLRTNVIFRTTRYSVILPFLQMTF